MVDDSDLPSLVAGVRTFLPASFVVAVKGCVAPATEQVQSDMTVELLGATK